MEKNASENAEKVNNENRNSPINNSWNQRQRKRGREGRGERK